MVAQFIDDYSDRFAVEPIYRVLKALGVRLPRPGITPSRLGLNRPGRKLMPKPVFEFERVFWDRRRGLRIRGVRKVWRFPNREEIIVARCTVERLMRGQGMPGSRRGRHFLPLKLMPQLLAQQITCNLA